MPERVAASPHDRPAAGVGTGAVSVAGAVAVLVAALAFLPAVQGLRWWFTAVLFTIVAVGVGAIGRRTGLPPAAAALVALSTVPLTAVAVAGGGDGSFLFLPTDAAAERVLTAFNNAFLQIYADSVPAQNTAALALLIGAGTGVTAIVVDLVAVSLRAPLAAVLVVLALAIIPGKSLFTGTDGWLLVAVAAALLLMVAADRRSRGAAPRLPGLLAGGAMAVVVALAVQVVLPAPVASVAQSAVAPLFGTGADPLVRLGENLRRGAATRVLSYSSDSPEPVYLRLAVLEDFSGDAWTPNPPDGRPLGADAPPPVPGLDEGDLGGVTRTEIRPGGPGAIGERLPLPYPAFSVEGPEGSFRWEDRGLNLVRRGSGYVGPYEVTSWRVDTRQTLLRQATVSVPDDAEATVTLPRRVPAIIRRTANAWTANADSPYEIALALQNRLRSDPFYYDEETPAAEGYDGDGLGVIADFLRVKAGYCVHFASTMAVMARLEGVPARIAVGYQPGEASGSRENRTFSVSSDDLHAWPELYFDGVGWVRFEPTPGRGAAPAYAPLPTVAATPTPTTPTPTVAAPTDGPTDAAAAAAESSRAAGESLLAAVRVMLIAVGAALLLAIPGVVRRIVRRRRLALGGARRAWREVVDSVLDLGLPTGAGRSPRAAESVLAEQVASTDGRAALARLRAAFERQAFGRSAVAVDSSDVSTVIAEVADRAGPGRRFRAAVAPRSLLGTIVPSRLAFGWSPPGSD